jgi:hypothetical protein
MQLQEFIKETLVQIATGVAEAQEALKEREVVINPRRHMLMTSSQGQRENTIHQGGVQRVSFDVAVTTTQSEKGVTTAGIVVGWVGLGAKGEDAASSGSVSRIKFDIPVVLPQS